MKKLTVFVLVTTILLGLLSSLGITPASAADSASDIVSKVIDFSLHELDDNTGYKPTSSNAVSTTSSGHTSLGTLTANGDYHLTVFGGHRAVALKGSSLSFVYHQSVGQSTGNNKTWHLSGDTAESIRGTKVGTIDNGAILIEKSFDMGKTWETATKVVKINDTDVTFIPDSSDIARGVLYRFTSVAEVYYTYKSGRVRDWHGPFYYTWKDTYANSYKNLAQVSTVYVASDTATVGYHSSDTDSYTLPNSEKFEGVSAEELEIIRKSATLTNNAVSLDYIRIASNHSSFSIKCSYNGGVEFTCNNGDLFTEEGHYRFTVTSRFGTVKVTNLYILHPEDDLAASKYFHNGSLMDPSRRMFNDEVAVPTYLAGTTYRINASKTLPPMFGSIYYYADESALASETNTLHSSFKGLDAPYTASLDTKGYYVFDLYSSDPNETVSGKILHYVFMVYISDDYSYAPTVNEDLLNATFRSLNYKTDAIAVNLTTAGGGNFVFLFDVNDEETALAFAEELELRFVETYTDKDGKTYYYYKDSGNQYNPTSSTKTRFDSKIELFQAIKAFSKANCNRVYLNPTEEYGKMSLDEAIEKVEEQSIKKDIRVVIDEATRASLMADDILLNDFVFTQVADYETSSVRIMDSKGNSYQIPYGATLSDYLKNTDFYTVIESNWNGINDYTHAFIAEGDNTAILDLLLKTTSGEATCTMTKANNGTLAVANEIVLLKGSDAFDSQTLITIVGTGSRVTMQLSDLNGYVLTEPDDYTIILENRLGYSYSIQLEIRAWPQVTVNLQETELAPVKTVFGKLPEVLPAPTRYGYSFLKWVDAEGNDLSDNTFRSLTPVDLFPVFEAKNITVTTILPTGISTTHNAVFGTTFTLPTIEKRTGYRVVWTCNNHEIPESFPISSTESLVCVASYNEIDVPVTFTVDGNSYTETYKYASSIRLPEVPEKANHTSHWHINGEKITGQYYFVYGSETVSAELIYTPLPCTVTVKDSFGSITTYEPLYGTVLTLPTPENISGYAFMGYFVNGVEVDEILANELSIEVEARYTKLIVETETVTEMETESTKENEITDSENETVAAENLGYVISADNGKPVLLDNTADPTGCGASVSAFPALALITLLGATNLIFGKKKI